MLSPPLVCSSDNAVEAVAIYSRGSRGSEGRVYEDCLPLELNDATAGCMCDGVGASDRIQLVDQSTHMELGGVDRYAKTASYCLV